MKLILIDNYNRETVSDILLAENVPEEFSEKLKEIINNSRTFLPSYWCTSVKDDYRLSKGMEDLI